MPTIEIGPQFFEKERDNLYSDPERAFCREYLQNSLDAGATRIDFNIRNLAPEGSGAFITVRDNGCGMTREVLEKVFFSLGATTKAGSGTVGGFGRARILTCFSMQSYYIRTGKMFVSGKGASYDIKEKERDFKGCKFSVIWPNKTMADLKICLLDVLSHSDMAANVYVNGEKFKNWLRTYNEARTLDCGSVWLNKSQPSNGVITIRVKGLWMFNISTSFKHQVVVEVNPSKSRDILTANRDSMHWAYQSNLTSWVRELDIDKKSALRDMKLEKTIVKGTGFIRSDNKKKEDKVQAPDRDIKVEPQRRAAALLLPGAISCREVESPRYTFGKSMPTVVVVVNTRDKRILSVVDNFNPENWVEKVKKVKGNQMPYRKGGNYMKLLVAWQAACAEAVNAYMQYEEMDQLSWVVGWTFSDDAQAEHETIHLEGEEGHAFYLNPVNSDGNLRFNLTRREHRMAMIALAKHEVAHAKVSAHNEDFSTLHTAIDARFDVARALRSMKDAVANV